MLTLKVECSNHQSNDGPWHGRELELLIIGQKDLDPQKLKRTIEKNRGWVVQFNGDYMDTYCSKKCAE